MVQEPLARFHLEKWEVFYYSRMQQTTLPASSKFNLTAPNIILPHIFFIKSYTAASL
jgi:hypothetical protein